MSATGSTLYYVHDPMCSWCYAFRPVWTAVKQQLPPTIKVQYVAGGLAPDSSEPMPADMRQYLQATWHKIMETVPGTTFNFDFWEQCTPRRSTYPACRAVLAAREQGAAYERPMIEAIQNAYYQQARNPSDDSTLIALAADLGLDTAVFSTRLASTGLQQALLAETGLAQSMGGHSFPSLIWQQDGKLRRIAHSYTDVAAILQQLMPA